VGDVVAIRVEPDFPSLTFVIVWVSAILDASKEVVTLEVLLFLTTPYLLA
jgi:hypothetical protein